MMRIRLIDPALAIPRYRQIRLPTVAAELAPYAEVTINDENVEPLDLSPVDLVGVTAQAYNAPRAIRIAARCRALGLKTLLGGPYATAMGAAALPDFDAVVAGEVEGLGERLVRDLERGELGGVYRLPEPPQGWGRRPARRDLQQADRYYSFNYPIEFSRGCPHRCSFCFGAFAYPTYRPRSLDSIARELAQWDHGLVEAVDLNFAANRDHAIAVCRLLTELKVAGWFGEATLASLDHEELLTHLERSNCKMVFVGIESLEEGALRGVGKQFNRVSEYRRIIGRIQDHGILVHGGFMWGLDGESAESFARAARFCDEAKIYLASTNLATYYPGTPAFAQLKSEGRLTTEDARQFDSAHVVVEPRGLTPAALRAGLGRFLGRFYGLTSIVRRSFQRPIASLAALVDFWAFNLTYRAYYRQWLSRVGRADTPWDVPVAERDSFPHVGGRMPLTYDLFDASWRFFHRWYAAWAAPPAAASLAQTTLLVLLVAVLSAAAGARVQSAALAHWPVPWPAPAAVGGAFVGATLLATWLTARLARPAVTAEPSAPPPGGLGRALRHLGLLVAVAPMAACLTALPSHATAWTAALSLLTGIFVLKGVSVLAARPATCNWRRVTAFLLLWPTLGIDEAFVRDPTKRHYLRHLPRQLLGLVKLVLGVLGAAALFDLTLRRFDPDGFGVCGDVGRLLALYLLVSGTLDYLTASWRMAGYAIPPPFGARPFGPARAACLWASWNTPLHRWLTAHVYVPLGGRRRPVLATLGTFAVAGGLFAAWLAPVVGTAAYRAVGFFLLGGIVVAAEKALGPERARTRVATGLSYVLSVALFLATARWLFELLDRLF